MKRLTITVAEMCYMFGVGRHYIFTHRAEMGAQKHGNRVIFPIPGVARFFGVEPSALYEALEVEA